MVIYADVLFLINFSMDYLILYLVSCGLHRGKRMGLCAFFGGIYGVLAVKFPLLGEFFFQILIGAIMVLISYRPMNIAQFVKAFFLFMTVSFLLGGMLYGIFSASGKGEMVNGILYFDFSLLQFAFFVLFSWLFLTAGNRIYNGTEQKGLRNVKIKNNGKEVVLSAFIDTGCELKEPLTGFPVMVAEYDKIDRILSDELKEFITMKNFKAVPERIYQIPYSTVKDETGLMTAFRPEQITIIDGKKEMILNRVLVGIVLKKMTENQSYSALLNPSMTI